MMLHAQLRHLADTVLPSLQQQQQQVRYVVTTSSTSKQTSHQTSNSTVTSTVQQLSTVVLPTSRRPVTSTTSGFTPPRPQPLPVPVARNSFRIDDILGPDETRRNELMPCLVPTAAARRNEPTERQTSTEISGDGELTVQARTDDISQLLQQQRQQCGRRQSLQHCGTHPSLHSAAGETSQRHTDINVHSWCSASPSDIERSRSMQLQHQQLQYGDTEVELRQRSSSPVIKGPRDSSSDLPSGHVVPGIGTSGGPSSQHECSTRSAADFHVSAGISLPLLRQSRRDQHCRLSPSMLLPNAAASAPALPHVTPHLAIHRRHHHQQQQRQHGQVADSVATAQFVWHHPLFNVPPSMITSPSPFSAVDPFQAFFASRHTPFLPAREFHIHDFNSFFF